LSASTAGTTRFTIANSGVASYSAGLIGSVLIDPNSTAIQTTQKAPLTLLGANSGGLVISGFGSGALSTNANGAVSTGTLSIANGGSNNTSFTAGSVIYYDGVNTKLTEDNSNFFYNTFRHQLGLGTTVTNSSLTVVGIASQPIASFSAIAANSLGVIIDSSNGNILSASASGIPRFTVTNSGVASVSAGTVGGITFDPSLATIQTSINQPLKLSGGGVIGGVKLSGYTNNNNSVLYTDGAGAMQVAETTNSNNCLLSNGSGAAPSWQTCPGGAASSTQLTYSTSTG